MLIPAASTEAIWQPHDWRFVEREVRAAPESISLAIIGAARIVRPRLSALLAAGADVQEQEAMILLGLGIGGPQLRTELARLLQSDGAAVGRSAKVLLTQELVEGRSSSGPVSLSPMGAEAFVDLLSILLEFERSALAGLEAAEMVRARSALAAVHLATVRASAGSRALRQSAGSAPANTICGRFIFQLILTSRLVSRVAADLIDGSSSRPPFEVRILSELSSGPLAQSALAHRLDCDKGQLSRMIGMMVLNGLVEIDRPRRHRNLYLTATGHRACRRFAAKLAGLEDAYRARIDQDGRTALLGAIEQIGYNLR